MTHTRRQLTQGALGLLLAACAPARSPDRSQPAFGAIEQRIGGRIGVFALDTGSGRHLAHRADERFAMCSTFKWLLAAAVLAQVDRRALSRMDPISYSAEDLLDYSPITRAHLEADAGTSTSLSVEALAEAAVTVSDNTAANLLLAKLGGPATLTAFAHECGDPVTRLDRNEPSLNENTPGDPRDTTTPRAMVTLMRRLLCEDPLSTASRALLLRWLRECKTGHERLRAGVPSGWSAGDKTGTGPRGATNDLAIVWPPQRAPLLIAAYLSDSDSEPHQLSLAHADIARLVVAHL